MVGVGDVWAEQFFFGIHFGACQPPATESNMAGVFVPMPRRECHKSVVGHFADDDHLTMCTQTNRRSCIVARVVCNVVPT